MSKRIKITFETMNGGKYKIIPDADIARSNIRIKQEMEPKIREHIRKQVLSQHRQLS